MDCGAWNGVRGHPVKSKPEALPTIGQDWVCFKYSNCFNGHGGTNVDLEMQNKHPLVLSVEDAMKKCEEMNYSGFTICPDDDYPEREILKNQVWYLKSITNPGKFLRSTRCNGWDDRKFDVHVRKMFPPEVKVTGINPNMRLVSSIGRIKRSINPTEIREQLAQSVSEPKYFSGPSSCAVGVAAIKHFVQQKKANIPSYFRVLLGLLRIRCPSLTPDNLELALHRFTWKSVDAAMVDGNVVDNSGVISAVVGLQTKYPYWQKKKQQQILMVTINITEDLQWLQNCGAFTIPDFAIPKTGEPISMVDVTLKTIQNQGLQLLGGYEYKLVVIAADIPRLNHGKEVHMIPPKEEHLFLKYADFTLEVFQKATDKFNARNRLLQEQPARKKARHS